MKLRKLFLLNALLLCCAVAPLGGFECKKPDTGPPGPQGAPGTPGADGAQGLPGRQGPVGPFIKRSASAYTQGVQTFDAVAGNAVDFQTNSYVPVGIVHPTMSGGTTEFAVLNDGYYFITFTLSVESENPLAIVSATLVDLTTGLPLHPDPFVSKSGVNNLLVQNPLSGNLSGQTIVFLTAGSVIQLQLSQDQVDNELTVTSPIFTIMQISP